jgi:hypothetical protein
MNPISYTPIGVIRSPCTHPGQGGLCGDQGLQRDGHDRLITWLSCGSLAVCQASQEAVPAP